MFMVCGLIKLQTPRTVRGSEQQLHTARMFTLSPTTYPLHNVYFQKSISDHVYTVINLSRAKQDGSGRNKLCLHMFAEFHEERFLKVTKCSRERERGGEREKGREGEREEEGRREGGRERGEEERESISVNISICLLQSIPIPDTLQKIEHLRRNVGVSSLQGHNTPVPHHLPQYPHQE